MYVKLLPGRTEADCIAPPADVVLAHSFANGNIQLIEELLKDKYARPTLEHIRVGLKASLS